MVHVLKKECILDLKVKIIIIDKNYTSKFLRELGSVAIVLIIVSKKWC